VRDLAQELRRVPLGLHRIVIGIVDPADDLDRLGAELDRLALACDATISPVARTAQPVVIRVTSVA